MPYASIRTICHISLVPSMLSPMQRNVPRCVSIMPMWTSSRSSEGSTICASRRNVAVCMMLIHLMDTISVHSVGRIGEPRLSRVPDRFPIMLMKKWARIASLSFRPTDFSMRTWELSTHHHYHHVDFPEWKIETNHQTILNEWRLFLCEEHSSVWRKWKGYQNRRWVNETKLKHEHLIHVTGEASDCHKRKLLSPETWTIKYEQILRKWMAMFLFLICFRGLFGRASSQVSRLTFHVMVNRITDGLCLCAHLPGRGRRNNETSLADRQKFISTPITDWRASDASSHCSKTIIHM